MRLKIASYNIQYGVGQDGRYDIARCTDALRDQDVICLQEVTTGWTVCNRHNQPELLAADLNLFAAHAPGYETDASQRNPDGVICNMRQGFGNMVLSRWPIVYSRAHSLPRPRTDVPPEFYPNVEFPRAALETVIDIEGTAMRVVSLHLSHLPGAQREVQVDVLKLLALSLPGEAGLWPDDPRISAWSGNRPAPPVPATTLFLGDFNFGPDDAGHARMTEPANASSPGLVDAWDAADCRNSAAETCVENDGRLSRLDYMFMTPGIAGSVRSASVDQAMKVSDHFPLYFDLDI